MLAAACDTPRCASRVIGAFVRRWSDDLFSDADRERLLKPVLPRLIGTRAVEEVEARRAFMALDWLVRVSAPAWLELVPSLREHAGALRLLHEICDPRSASVALVAEAAAATKAARRAAVDDDPEEASDAAFTAVHYAGVATSRAALRDGACSAAEDGASAAKAARARKAAAEAVSGAAWLVGWRVGWGAGMDATQAPARELAMAAVRPTVERLQASALELIDRMIHA